MPNFKDYLQLHFIVLIWGFTAILGKLISIPAVELVLYRTFWASLLLVILLKIRKQALQISPQAIAQIMGTGMLIAAHWILFFAAAKLNASVCLAGMTTATLWTSVIEPIVHQRRIKTFEIFLGLVVILGLYIIFQFEFNHLAALVMAIFSAFLAALFSVINSQLIKQHNHHLITLYEMVGAFLGTLLFVPFYLLYLSDNQQINLNPSLLDWLYILILAGICTVYAYSVGVKLMKKFTPFAVNLTVNLEPVYGIILALFIFGKSERMNLGFYVGTGVILSAVLTYPYLKKYFAKIKKHNIHRALSKRKNQRAKISV